MAALLLPCDSVLSWHHPNAHIVRDTTGQEKRACRVRQRRSASLPGQTKRAQIRSSARRNPLVPSLKSSRRSALRVRPCGLRQPQASVPNLSISLAPNFAASILTPPKHASKPQYSTHFRRNTYSGGRSIPCSWVSRMGARAGA